MLKSDKVLFALSIVGFVFCLVILYLTPVNAEDSTAFEGLPIYWTCSIVPGGISEIVCQSNSFAITTSDYEWLMPGDEEGEYLGDMGVFQSFNGSMTWYRVPEGYTLSIFPGHIPEGITPIKPPLFDLIEEYSLSHIGFYKLSEGQYIMKRTSDGIVPAALSLSGKQYYQYYPDPEPECVALVQNPYVLEYRATIVGDISDLVIPSPTMSYIYRVLKPTN